MDIIATQKFLRLSPKKMRPIANIVKKLTAQEAIDVLPHIGKRAAEPLAKVIKTAMANAKERGADLSALIFKTIEIGQGPTLKRGQPVSRGRWHPIKKRTSHIRVVLTTEPRKVKVKGEKKVAPVVEKVEVKKVKPVSVVAKKAVKKTEVKKEDK